MDIDMFLFSLSAMGVSGLWELVQDAKEEVQLKDDCCGKKLAVDLSSWIVQCSSIQTQANVSPIFLCYRFV